MELQTFFERLRKIPPAKPTNMDDVKLLMGKLLSEQFRARKIKNLSEAEFKVFSQWGDDGIIQHLIQNVAISNTIFVEFGVENYTESNTRFLLMNDNWKGLIIDGSDKHMKRVRSENLYWRHDLTAVTAFVTRDNINSLLSSNGISGPIGILSIDIDGNDYWVWEKIEVVDPDIVIVEYNSVFGPDHAVTIPYSSDFYRSNAHFSNLYWGASLKALVFLGEKKGFHFIGCNQNGNNAYFVKKEKRGDLPIKTVEDGYVESRFRESRDAAGNLTFVSGKDRLTVIRDQEVVDVISGQKKSIKDLYRI